MSPDFVRGSKNVLTRSRVQKKKGHEKKPEYERGGVREIVRSEGIGLRIPPITLPLKT